MVRTLYHGRGALLLAGLALLIWGGLLVFRTAGLLAHGTTATGVVWHVQKRLIWVELPQSAGIKTYLPAYRPWWLLFRYRRGSEVSVVYDPAADYDRPFFPARARIRTWSALWPGPGTLLLSGFIFCALYFLPLLYPGRVRTAFRVDLEQPCLCHSDLTPVPFPEKGRGDNEWIIFFSWKLCIAK